MSDTFKCAWCGRHFEKSAGAKFLSGASMGLSNLGKKYCSKACENSANESKNGAKGPSFDSIDKQPGKTDPLPRGANASGVGSSTIPNKAPGLGHFLGKTMNDSLNMLTTQAAKADEEELRKENKINDLANLKMSSEKEELLEQLSYLASLASSKPEKAIKSVIVEKMEFGIMKLKGMGAGEEAVFFQSKIEPLKKKGLF